MLTPEDVQKISDIIEDMTDEEVEAALGRIMNLADMEKRITSAYETNPMVFSSCETIQ